MKDTVTKGEVEIADDALELGCPCVTHDSTRCRGIS